jgi:hypothetical protein
MTLDDRAADEKANTHAISVGRVKRIEATLEGLRSDTATVVPHGLAHTIAFFLRRRY